MLPLLRQVARHMQTQARKENYELKYHTAEYGADSISGKHIAVAHQNGMICIYERKNYEGKIWIGSVMVNIEHRRKGIGSLLMKKLIDAADHFRLDLNLSAYPFHSATLGGLDQDELFDWYERHGFIRRGNRRCNACNTFMERNRTHWKTGQVLVQHATLKENNEPTKTS